GLARILKGDFGRLTVPGQMLGTVAYMPPEQAMGDVQAMGPACDIYSLGVVLYHLSTGQLPFVGSLYSVLHQILHVQPSPPSKYQGKSSAPSTMALVTVAPYGTRVGALRWTSPAPPQPQRGE